MKGAQPTFQIGTRRIGAGFPAYIIAELSANHCGEFERALQLVRAAKECGADAVKLQTYTADTLTIDCDADYFKITGGTWGDRRLHELYREASMPWEWQPKLKREAGALGLHCFSTPFDSSAVDFLQKMDVPAYKIASFELIDLPLIETVAATGKPMILSTGMANVDEIREAVETVRSSKAAPPFALLKCVSSYPARPEDMNLATLADMAERFQCVVGISDHTLGIEVPIAAVALGARIIEKHFTLSRADGGPDAPFSLEPSELKAMVAAVRNAEKAVGRIAYGRSLAEEGSVTFRRSLFVVQDVKCGELFTVENVRSIRPGHGLPPKHLKQILGARAARDIARGTPLDWKCIQP